MKKLLFLSAALIFLSCGLSEPNSGRDKTPPRLKITYPPDDATIDGDIRVKVAAIDDGDLERVLFFVDGDTVFSDVTPPFEFDWSVAFWADGERHTVYAEATDKGGNTGQSEVIAVTLASSPSLTPVLVFPPDNSAFEDANRSFVWREYPGAERYELQLSSAPDFDILLGSTPADTTTALGPLATGMYYWRVRAQNRQNRWSEWSSLRTFSIIDLSMFEGADGLVAYYPLNGNAYDESPNGHHGTVHGARPCEDRLCNENCAYQFFSDDYIDFGDVFNDLDVPFSISLWAWCTQYPLGIFNSDCFYMEGVSVYFGFWFQVSNDGSLQVSYGDGGCAGYQCRRSRFSNDQVPLNRWIHLAASVEGPLDMKVFINGAEANGYLDGDGGAMVHNRWRAFLCGYQAGGSKIDEVRIYSRAIGF